MKKVDKATELTEAEILAFLQAQDAALSGSESSRAKSAADDSLKELWDSLDPLAKLGFPELEAYDQAQAKQSAANKAGVGSIKPVARQSGDVIAAGSWRKVFHYSVAIAAVIFVSIGLGIGYWGVPQHYRVASGDQLSVIMDDGSKLLMQGGTDLEIAEGWGRRHVQLSNGYVFFEVAKNKHKPFTIDNGDSRIRVLGTSFSVYKTGRRLELTVEHGTVSLADTGKGQAGYQFMLNKNQKVVVDKTASSEPQARLIRQIDPEKEFSWRHGEVYFSEQTLEDIVQRMSNFYPQPIQIMNAEHRKIKLTGNYSTTDFSAFLKALALAADLRIEKGPHGNILIF